MVKDLAIQILIKKVEELTRRLEKFGKENKILHHENALLKAKNAELKAELEELKARLDSNSHNSNKPPSSDGYKKKTVKPALPRSKGSRQGGQEGHKGHTLKQVEAPDKIVICTPGVCTCGHEFEKEELMLAEKRQVFDLPQPKLEITEYQIFKASCPECGQEQKGVAPEGVNAPAQYGNKVKAFVVLLNVHYTIPYKKIQLLFSDLFGYPINESTISSADEKCYEKLEESENIIKSKIIGNNVVHADETGLRTAEKLHWLHTATTLLYTYLFVHEKRGSGAIQSNKSILMDYIGWLVHDCWGSYFNLKNLKHAICGAHILRELQGLIDGGETKWAKVFKSFLLSIYMMPFEERIKRRNHIESRYDRICGFGEKTEPPPVKTAGRKGRYKRTQGRNLVERLIRGKDAVLAFAFNKEVPFTNNLAERDIRPAKVKQKISNIFRTFKGAEIYARIEGFISTARKNQRCVFTELCTTFEGHNFIT
ncbi:MAG TPA: IS66 family transposase [Bacteroidales bacterium]|nr:IS66 family transposase [Bacteroidales bacterium]